MSARRTAAAMAGALEAFQPITLPEVLAEAALQVRVDRKYLVPVETFVELAARLRGSCAALQIDGKRTFRYESVYFDTADHRLYRDHVQQRRRRYKLRTRTYLDSGECSLEVKLHGARSETVKSRIPYAPEDRARLTPTAQAFLADRLRANGAQPTKSPLEPVLTTTYQRSTLVDPTNHTRLTCDIDLRFTNSTHHIDAPPPLVLIESKTPGRAGVADDILRTLNVRPLPLSKYCIAAALLNPHLPTNPHHRTLRRFTAAG